MRRASILFVVISVVLVVLATLLADLSNPFLRVNLSSINNNAYDICANLVKNPLVHNKNIKFYISCNPWVWLAATGLEGGGELNKQVYFGPLAAKRADFEILAAHEIGHVERGESQYEANLFALRLVGNQKRELFIGRLKWVGNSDKYINEVLQEFDAYYNKEQTDRLTVGAIKTNANSPKGPILLRKADPTAYQVCIEIIKRAPFLVEPEVEFFVEPDLTQKAVAIVNKAGPSWVYFHPLSLALERRDFEALVAHELGHIDCRCGDEETEYQIRADRFATRIVGKNSVRNLLLKHGLLPEDPRLLALK